MDTTTLDAKHFVWTSTYMYNIIVRIGVTIESILLQNHAEKVMELECMGAALRKSDRFHIPSTYADGPGAKNNTENAQTPKSQLGPYRPSRTPFPRSWHLHEN